jgi:hypothetical protein
LASSLRRKLRLSKFVEPTEASLESTSIILQWNMVGWNSEISAPACNNSPQSAREAWRTTCESMCLPGTMMRTLTPRLSAARARAA